MRFSITADQRDHFAKHGFITFEGVVSPEMSVERRVRLRALADVAADLADEHPLRLGWYLEARALPAEPLEQLGSVQGIVMGAAVAANGDVTLFAPQHIFSLAEESGEEYLLIAYARRDAVYVLNKRDPHTHELKRQGYVFGDRLREETHPILAR